MHQLFLPAWRQLGGLHTGVGDGMGQLQSEDARRDALEDGHAAVVIAEIILGLAPTIRTDGGSRQSQQHQNGDDDTDDAVALGVRTLGLALLDLLVADGPGDFRIVRIGGDAAVVLLHDGDFAGVRIGAIARFLAYGRRLRHTLLRLRLVVGLVGVPAMTKGRRACGR